ncbi:hypothetical protein BKK49_08090 [Rodentibacter rarus]|uniref:endonuclease/exonuclease/phosphatase family protein n=1 Tax=Rodentibacter rarus TaxID=1908260 RepID=UPI00098696B3|nr:endonuclease/exonuclease/phosphatase family protein [Rodentibacter rarus]OOF39391.1 hypothetical protein BKK49_08090 [Rodentibacter rarus]
MKRINKIFVFLPLIGIAFGIHIFNQFRIFEPVRMDFKSQIRLSFSPLDSFCFFAVPKSVPVLEKKPIRLLSWNIHKGEDQGWQQDLVRFSQHQDMVLLQEATAEQNLSSFSTALSVSGFAYKGRYSGVKTFSQAIPQRYCGLSQPEPWIFIPKVASMMSFPLNNREELVVINVHLINFEWTPEAYQAQLERIFSLIPPSQSAVILAGDFNAWNEERKKILDEFVTQAGLNEVSFVPDERRYFFNYPLDFVFVRGMKVLSSKTETVTSSDHSPIWVALAFE